MTSAIGNPKSRNCGFTIIEVVLVLGLIALAASIMIVNMTTLAERGGKLNADESLQAAIRRARFIAANDRNIVTLRFDEETGTLKLSNDETFELGPDFGVDGRGEVRFYLVEPSEGLSPLADPKNARIETDKVLFAPDRSSTPFVVELDSGDGTPERIIYDPFSSLRKGDSE